MSASASAESAAGVDEHAAGWTVRRALVVADAVSLLGAFSAAEFAFGVSGTGPGGHKLLLEAAAFLAGVPLWILVAAIAHLYDRDEDRPGHSTADELLELVAITALGAWLFLLGAKAFDPVEPSLAKVVGLWVLAALFVGVGRVLARWIVHRGRATERAIIVGAGYAGQLIARKLADHPDYGVQVVGFVDAEPRLSPRRLLNLPLLGRPTELPAIAAEHRVQRAFVAFSLTPDDELLAPLRELRRRGLRIDVIPRFFELAGPRTLMHHLEGLPLMGTTAHRSGRAVDVTKRALDLAVASVLLVVLAPLLLCVAAVVAAESGRPVLYRHRRVGLNGRPFDLLKFRTMQLRFCRGAAYGGDSAEQELARILLDRVRQEEFERTYKLADDPRVTRVGRVLRRFSLDELPQLINVARGEISLVGPRPITEAELERYGDSVGVLLGAKPGVTGYWQINGRSRTDYVERVRLDLAYLMDRSFGLDLKILAKTPQNLRPRSGAC